MTLHKFKMITKPLWIPIITGIYLLAADSADPIVISALFFGWIGDLLLMRGRKSWFVAGAVSFMIGHLFYAYVFLIDSGGFAVFHEHPLFCIIAVLPCVGYLYIIKRMLTHNVSSVFYAVAVYLSVLMFMSYAALLRVFTVQFGSWLLTFGGSLLFIASDTLIGYRNFKRKFRGIGVVVVVTYIAAQLLIITGLV